MLCTYFYGNTLKAIISLLKHDHIYSHWTPVGPLRAHFLWGPWGTGSRVQVQLLQWLSWIRISRLAAEQRIRAVFLTGSWLYNKQPPKIHSLKDKMTCQRLHKSSVAEPGNEPSSATDVPWLQSDPSSKDLHIATWWDNDTFYGQMKDLLTSVWQHLLSKEALIFLTHSSFGHRGQVGCRWGGRTQCLQNGGRVGLGDSFSLCLTNITFLCLKDGMNWVCKNVNAKKK